ncbi:MAG: DeoR/GlpR family DNA-binding transcription regulator [Candidatus Pacebacteria bacterium]|nr:DeoR/GlpR family DNA-binding transcription regulator [Candidatus Paceibacterota bacterium]
MNDHRLLTPEREEKILDLLRETTVLTVAELSDTLGVSPATIRRDLQSMHERKLLERVRGGATLRRMTRVEPLFHDKQSQNTAAKQAIATAALKLVEDHDRIYLDGGSTILMLARLLEARHDLTVVTNSLMAAAELMTCEHLLILVGGEFRALSRTLVGPLTTPVVQSVHVDKAFMGTIGFTLKDGMTTTDPSEAFTKERVMERANQVILLADSSKLGVPSFTRSGVIEDVDVLVTDAIDNSLKKELESLGIEVIVAD